MTNGYTQITIGDNPVGLKFAYLCIKLFTQASIGKVDVYFSDGVDEKGKPTSMLTVFGIAKLFQSAYINNCELKESKQEYTFEQFHDYVESLNDTEEGQAELVRVLKVYTDSTYTKKMIDSKEKKSQVEKIPTPIPTETTT